MNSVQLTAKSQAWPSLGLCCCQREEGDCDHGKHVTARTGFPNRFLSFPFGWRVLSTLVKLGGRNNPSNPSIWPGGNKGQFRRKTISTFRRISSGVSGAGR